MQAKSRLLDFFLSLNDDETLKRFQADPDGVMSEAGLSDDEKALMKSGDEAKVREALGDQSQALSARYIMPPSPES